MGTGVESFAKLADGAYFEGEGEAEGEGEGEGEDETRGTALRESSPQMVVERCYVLYCGTVYGVPDDDVLRHGQPFVCKSVDELNNMLNSKSPKSWETLRTKHITVCRSTKKNPPDGWHEGQCDAPNFEELPRETFYYVNLCVTPRPEDSDLIRKRHDHDKRLLRVVPKAVAIKLKGRFENLTTITQEQREGDLAPIFNWAPSASPQVNPLLSAWPAYNLVKLQTAFCRKLPTPRVRGPASRNGAPGLSTAVETDARSVSLHKQHPGEDDASTNSALTSQTQNSGQSAAARNEMHRSLQDEGLERYRVIEVANGARTCVHIQGNKVFVFEFRDK